MLKHLISGLLAFAMVVQCMPMIHASDPQTSAPRTSADVPSAAQTLPADAKPLPDDGILNGGIWYPTTDFKDKLTVQSGENTLILGCKQNGAAPSLSLGDQDSTEPVLTIAPGATLTLHLDDLKAKSSLSISAIKTVGVCNEGTLIFDYASMLRYNASEYPMIENAAGGKIIVNNSSSTTKAIIGSDSGNVIRSAGELVLNSGVIQAGVNLPTPGNVLHLTGGTCTIGSGAVIQANASTEDPAPVIQIDGGKLVLDGGKIQQMAANQTAIALKDGLPEDTLTVKSGFLQGSVTGTSKVSVTVSGDHVTHTVPNEVPKFDTMRFQITPDVDNRIRSVTYRIGTGEEKALTADENQFYLIPGIEVVDSVSIRIETGMLCLVTFDGNGGSGVMDGSTVTGGDSYRLPECAFTPPEGSYFTGWKVGETIYQPGDTLTPTSPITVSAQWARYNLLTLNPNNGTEEAPVIQEFKQQFTVPECPFTPPEGKRFYQWQEEGTQNFYQVGDTLSRSADLVLNACWINEQESYFTADLTEMNGDLTYVVNQNTINPNVVSVLPFSDVTLRLDHDLTVEGLKIDERSKLTITGNGTLTISPKTPGTSISIVGSAVLVIDSGKLELQGFEQEAIHVESRPNGQLFINGGIVTVTGGSQHPGIAGGEVYINGGKVTATGGPADPASADAHLAPGIANNVDLFVTDGELISSSNRPLQKRTDGSCWIGSPGIGGTNDPLYGTIDISGGKVTAIGTFDRTQDQAIDKNYGAIRVKSITVSGGILECRLVSAVEETDINPLDIPYCHFGNFTTGADGKAVIDAPKFSETSVDSSDWAGLFLESRQITVGGTQTLNQDLTVNNQDMIVMAGAELTIPDTVTLTIADNDQTHLYNYGTIKGTVNGKQQEKSYTLTFDPNGGSGSMEPIKYMEGRPIELPEPAFTAPENAEFVGWEINGTKYNIDAPITLTSDTTAKALWKKIITISFLPGLGTGTMAPITRASGTTYRLTRYPTFQAPEGYSFAGWYVDGILMVPDTTISPDRSITLVAAWIKNLPIENSGIQVLDSSIPGAEALFDGKQDTAWTKEYEDPLMHWESVIFQLSAPVSLTQLTPVFDNYETHNTPISIYRKNDDATVEQFQSDFKRYGTKLTQGFLSQDLAIDFKPQGLSDCYAIEFTHRSSSLFSLNEIYLSYIAEVLPEIYGHNVAIGDQVGINFIATIPDSMKDSAFMRLIPAAKPGQPAPAPIEIKTSDAEALTIANSYRFSCPLPAKEMTDMVYAELVLPRDDGSECILLTSDCSTEDYAKTVLTGNYEPFVTDAVRTMLNYGAAAQTHFGYRTNALANRSLNAADQVIAGKIEDFEPYSFTAPADLQGLSYYGSSLNLESSIQLLHYFVLKDSESISDYTFELTAPSAAEAVTLTPEQDANNASVYCLAIKNIYARDLNKVFKLKITNTKTGEVMNLDYSPFHYGYAVCHNEELSKDQTLLDLLCSLLDFQKAMQIYHDNTIPKA